MTITSLNIQDGTVGRRRLPRLKKSYVIAAVLVVILCICLGLAYHYNLFSQKPPEEVALQPPNPTKPLPPSASALHEFKSSVVCADGPACAEIGKNILEQGGNAMDAAISALFCNGIVTMQSMGLGGGFLMTVYIQENKTAYSLNARETAPLRAYQELYKNDSKTSQTGALSIGVPGELKGYYTAHKRFGKLAWKHIVNPTVEMCRKGYKITKHQYESSMKNELAQNDTTFREWFFNPDGKRKKIGDVVVPTQLCRTLEIIAENGGDDLYNGTLSKLLLEDLEKLGSIITKDDLENYKATWQDPISVQLKSGQTLYSVPPPGSGILLGFIMNILDGFNFKPKDISGVENTVGTYQKIVEAFKYAYAKRTELGDTAFVNISQLVKNLTSPEYAAKIRSKIRVNSTSSNPKDYGAVYYARDDHGTAHISVLGENGDAVSVTSSVNIYFGSGHISANTGIVLNSVMDDFSFPYFDNYFGLPGSPNNEIKPGKRPLSSMSPAILVDGNGDAKIVIGASGGTKITTAVALVIMRMLWFGQNIKEAVDAPRIHHQLYPMKVEYEYGTLQGVVDGLTALGHNMSRYKDVGSVVCALLKESERIVANADFRKGGNVYGI